jgi:hypothetical protein
LLEVLYYSILVSALSILSFLSGSYAWFTNWLILQSVMAEASFAFSCIPQLIQHCLTYQ